MTVVPVTATDADTGETIPADITIPGPGGFSTITVTDQHGKSVTSRLYANAYAVVVGDEMVASEQRFPTGTVQITIKRRA